MQKESIKMNHNSRRFNAILHGVGFKDGDFHIIYIPSLELSAYGDTVDEAHEMMKETLRVFPEDLFNCSQIEAENMLSGLGWKQEKYFPKRLVNLSTTIFEDIKKQFHLPESTTGREITIAI